MEKKNFDIDVATGLLQYAEFLQSPNYDARPDGAEIDLLVIHNICLPPKKFGGNAIVELFLNQLDCNAHPSFAQLVDLKVSAHLLIRRDGEVKQFVPFTHRAWHAGESSFNSKARCNDFSIGIELEGTDDIPYTTIQYQHLSHIVALLQKTYPNITKNRIVGHHTIAPIRKTDPGPAFDWAYFHDLLEKEITDEVFYSDRLYSVADTP